MNYIPTIIFSQDDGQSTVLQNRFTAHTLKQNFFLTLQLAHNILPSQRVLKQSRQHALEFFTKGEFSSFNGKYKVDSVKGRFDDIRLRGYRFLQTIVIIRSVYIGFIRATVKATDSSELCYDTQSLNTTLRGVNICTYVQCTSCSCWLVTILLPSLPSFPHYHPTLPSSLSFPFHLPDTQSSLLLNPHHKYFLATCLSSSRMFLHH